MANGKTDLLFSEENHEAKTLTYKYQVRRIPTTSNNL